MLVGSGPTFARTALRAVAPGIREQLSGDFSLNEGGQQHFFSLAPGEAEAQVVVRPDSRIIAAFPAENSGVSLWFEPGAQVTATEPPRSKSSSHGQELEVRLRSHKGELDISDAVLGSIRTIREHMHGTGEVERIQRDSEAWARVFQAPSDWVSEQARLNGNVLRFTRTELDGGRSEASLVLPPQVKATRSEDGWHLSAPGPFDFTLQARIPDPPLGGYAPEELFSPASLHLLEGLSKQGDPRARRCLSS
ncbi:MAG: hypothetical protein AB1758_19230, partial [Candidatus Eremiobacterota bacterium]